MKDFFNYVGATIVGLVIFSFAIAVIGFMSLVGMVASTEATKNVSKNSVLFLDLDGTMQEQTTESLMDRINGTTSLALNETLSAIKKAKDNDKVKGIYIKAGNLNADMAQIEEIREALSDFKKSGKWILAYGDNYTQLSYYLASVANKIYMNPQGSVDWHGIGGQVMFMKDALAKIGVKMIPIKKGKFKGATEVFTEDRMSEPNRQQTERYINGWWETICSSVSKSRNVSVDSLNAYADRVIALEAPTNFLKYKLVDGLLYSDQIKDSVKKMLDLEKDDKLNLISVSDMSNVKEKVDGDNIAVYYAFGDIVNEELPQSFMMSGHQIAADKVCRDLEKLAEDEDIKAVVIRVNSGGGSAYASEQIWHQVEMLKQKKPVVISMGGAAASGGYYISAAANYIFAEPSTITGSIGIFGIMRDVSELMTQKIGFKYDEIKTNKNSNMGNGITPLTPEQIGYIQASIDRGYTLFKSRVADGRKMSMVQVEERAQGHVYLGKDALQLKLVDELGGLDKAVAKAAQLAKLKTYYTSDYPAPLGLMEQIMEDAENNEIQINQMLQNTLGVFYQPYMIMKMAETQSDIQAKLPFILKVN